MRFLWVFEPDAVWTLIPAVSLLWALGGSGIKACRRFGVPILVCAAALSLGVKWWLVLINAGSMFALMSLPYGSGIRGKLGLPLYWVWLYMVGALYAAAMLPLAFHVGHWLAYGLGAAASGVVFGTLTLTSQTMDWPRWKWVEMALGACLGIQAASLLF